MEEEKKKKKRDSLKLHHVTRLNFPSLCFPLPSAARITIRSDGCSYQAALSACCSSAG